MKLRIQGNSLRLRVTRPELAALLETGQVVETTRFAPGPDGELAYSLACAECSNVDVRYSAGALTVVLPWPVARLWASESEVGVSASIDVGGAALTVLVEKDFACLHGTEEENRGTFPNPKMPI